MTAQRADRRPVHEPIITRCEPAPRGWREAWTWTCTCGVESASILRSPGEARTDHRREHLETPARST